MPISFVGVTTGVVGTGGISSASTGQISVPAGIQAGDLLVLCAAKYDKAGDTMSPDGVFTELAEFDYDNGNNSVAMFWKVAGNEPSSYTISVGAFTYATLIMAAYRGQQPTPVGASGAAAVGPIYTDPLSHTIHTMTAPTAGKLLMFPFIKPGAASYDGYAWPSHGTATLRASRHNGTIGGLYDQDVSAGTTPSHTFGPVGAGAASVERGAYLVLLTDPAAGGPRVMV